MWLPFGGSWGVSQHSGYYFWEPYNQDCNIVGSILGSPHLGKIPCKFYKGTQVVQADSEPL